MSAQPNKVQLAHPAPANDPPEPRTMESIAAELGFRHARAARDWCRRRGVPYTRDGKFNWVDRRAVLAAIARGRTVVMVAPPPAPASVAGWVDATLGGRRGT